MNLKELTWTKDEYKKYIEYLITLSDEKYKEFNQKIVNTKMNMIGIRMPLIKSIAMLIRKSNVENYLDKTNFKYYEEVLIYSLVLSKLDENYIDKYLINFIESIDNWAICDTFCSSFKLPENKQGKYWMYFTNLIDLNKEFQTRISIVMLMKYYLNDNYIDRVLNIVTNIHSDYYYINMAISWLLSEAIIYYEDKIISILKSKRLSKFIQNKTISKINDSYRIDKSLKEKIKQYRI